LNLRSVSNFFFLYTIRIEMHDVIPDLPYLIEVADEQFPINTQP